MSSANDPFRSPVDADAQFALAGNSNGANQGMLTTVCVLTYILGGFNLLGGSLTLAVGIFMFASGFPEQGMGSASSDPAFVTFMRYMMIAMVVVGAIFALSSIVAFIAGYGIQTRRRWGYQLGIVIAAGAGVETLLVLLTFWPLSPLYMFYTVFSLVVLLSPQNRAAFR